MSWRKEATEEELTTPGRIKALEARIVCLEKTLGSITQMVSDEAPWFREVPKEYKIDVRRVVRLILTHLNLRLIAPASKDFTLEPYLKVTPPEPPKDA